MNLIPGSLSVLHVIPSLQGGGAEKQMILLCITQAKAGYRVHILYWQKANNKIIKELESFGIKLIKKKVYSNYSPRILWHICQSIVNCKPDLIQTYISQVDIYGGIAAIMMKTSWVIREPSDKKRRKQTPKLRIRKFIGRYATAIVANSSNGLSYWDKVRTTKCVIRNGYKVPCRTVKKFRENNRKLIYVGRLEQSKNIDLLLRCLKEISDSELFTLDIIGAGTQEIKLKDWVHLNGMSSRVTFHGFISPSMVRSKLFDSDIFCTLSAHEGMPNAVIESMLAGTPIIASDIPGHREILDENISFFVSISDFDRITKTMERAIKTPVDKLISMSNNAYDRAAQLNLEKMQLQYHNLYHQILTQ